MSCIQSAVIDTIFTKIMACEIAKEAWDKLRDNDETIRQYTDRLMKVVNRIRLLGEELIDKKIVEKVLVSLPKKFESNISSLEDSRYLSNMSLLELVNALQALK